MRRQSHRHLAGARHNAILFGAFFLFGMAGLARADGYWYATATGGITFLGDESGATLTDPATSLTPAVTQAADLEFGSGFSAGAAVGRWFNDNWRAELEWMYRSNDNDRVTTADGRTTGDGNFASSALSVNGFYHFGDAAAIGAFTPYLGAGLSWVNEIDIDLEGGDFGAAYEDMEDDGVGFQVMGGFSYRQSDNLRWNAEARWLFFGDADLERDAGQRIENAGYAPFGLYVGVTYEF